MKCQAIIAGVGGQGVLFAARILTETARRNNLPVLSSQTFGMAQRGGSVMTHLKIGAFAGSLIREGDADLLLGLDCVEAHRTLPYLHSKQAGRSAVCIVNAPNARAFPDRRVLGLLSDMGVAIHTCQADGEALKMHNPLLANLVLLGFASRREGFPFPYDEVREATETLSNQSQRQVNLEALARGLSL